MLLEFHIMFLFTQYKEKLLITAKSEEISRETADFFEKKNSTIERNSHHCANCAIQHKTYRHDCTLTKGGTNICHDKVHLNSAFIDYLFRIRFQVVQKSHQKCISNIGHNLINKVNFQKLRSFEKRNSKSYLQYAIFCKN